MGTEILDQRPKSMEPEHSITAVESYFSKKIIVKLSF